MTTRQQDRYTHHATRLSRRAFDEAGTRRAVGRAIGKNESTITHEIRTRVNPEVYRMLIGMMEAPDVTVRPLCDAITEAPDMGEIVRTDTDVLTARFLELAGQENTLAGREQACCIGSLAHAEALERVARAAVELAQIIRELELRGIDAGALWRQRSGVAA